MKGETRTPAFLKMNSAGQVPMVEFDDGRTLAQSNAIIRYLAAGSDLIPRDAYAAAKMDEWLFWEQYSHEPYIAVCRFQMVYLGKPAQRPRSGKGQARLCGAGADGAAASPPRASSPARPSRSRTCRCLPIPASRMRAASISTAMLPSAAGSARPRSVLGLPAAKQANAMTLPTRPSRSAAPAAMMSWQSWKCWPTMHSAARASGSRIRCRHPILRRSTGSSRSEHHAGGGGRRGRRVVGCLQLCILPGLSSQGSLARADRGRARRLATAGAAASASSWCSGRLRKRAAAAASWSSC